MSVTKSGLSYSVIYRLTGGNLFASRASVISFRPVLRTDKLFAYSFTDHEVFTGTKISAQTIHLGFGNILTSVFPCFGDDKDSEVTVNEESKWPCIREWNMFILLALQDCLEFIIHVLCNFICQSQDGKGGI